MSLADLPSVVLNVIVESVGFEHGWRLEIASPFLKAASMECAATRLGKCRWVGGDRQGIEFKPSWRHVAVAMRRCTYHLCRPFHDELIYTYFEGGAEGMLARGVLRDRRHEADKFIILKANQEDHVTPLGEGIIRRINTRAVGESRSPRMGNLSLQVVPGTGESESRTYMRVWTPGIGMEWSLDNAFWLLPLGSYASHLPFRDYRGRVGGHIYRVLRAMGPYGQQSSVEYWELAPATLAVDERFQWRV